MHEMQHQKKSPTIAVAQKLLYLCYNIFTLKEHSQNKQHQNQNGCSKHKIKNDDAYIFYNPVLALAKRQDSLDIQVIAGYENDG